MPSSSGAGEGTCLPTLFGEWAQQKEPINGTEIIARHSATKARKDKDTRKATIQTQTRRTTGIVMQPHGDGDSSGMEPEQGVESK